ncbi:PREDICTED: nuclear RNA export factor 2-like, partial [Lipotes vexillifer]|uniref:Nuclear RNA export factor 2-like n=1 Tax=Lipotes vexillifer TaxID=118797 RepID=A0A340X5X0_LIPVE
MTVWRNRKPLEREMGENTQDGTPGSWFTFTIPHGIKYDRTWLMNSIQRHCSVPFTPVDFHLVKNVAQFFVQEASTACALLDVSYKIRDEESRKVCIPVFVSLSAVPYSVQYKLKSGEMEQLELTLIKRFDVSKQALDLQRLCVDPGTADSSNSRASCMAATLQVIEKNFPELLSLNLSSNKLYQLDGLSDIIQMAPTVKILNLSNKELTSVWELSKMQGLKLEELWLQGNPLCDTIPDQSTYVRAIRECLPKLLRLDGQELTSPVTVDVDTPYMVKPCKRSFLGSDELKSLVLQILQQQKSVLSEACGTGPFGQNTVMVVDHLEEERKVGVLSQVILVRGALIMNLCAYFKDRRNMKKLKDPYLRVQLLKHTKHVIVHTLCVLPKTQHDFSSFVVDTWFQTQMMLCFSVCGVFKAVEGSSQGCVRSFTWTFIANPAGYC